VNKNVAKLHQAADVNKTDSIKKTLKVKAKRDLEATDSYLHFTSNTDSEKRGVVKIVSSPVLDISCLAEHNF